MVNSKKVLVGVFILVFGIIGIMSREPKTQSNTVVPNTSNIEASKEAPKSTVINNAYENKEYADKTMTVMAIAMQHLTDFSNLCSNSNTTSSTWKQNMLDMIIKIKLDNSSFRNLKAPSNLNDVQNLLVKYADTMDIAMDCMIKGINGNNVNDINNAAAYIKLADGYIEQANILIKNKVN